MHGDLETKYPVGSELRLKFIKQKVSALNSQQSVFVKQSAENRNIVKASYEMTLLLAKNKKPVTDGEVLIKPALEIISKLLDDNKVTEKLRNIALSNNTMTRRVDELAQNVTDQV